MGFHNSSFRRSDIDQRCLSKAELSVFSPPLKSQWWIAFRTVHAFLVLCSGCYGNLMFCIEIWITCLKTSPSIVWVNKYMKIILIELENNISFFVGECSPSVCQSLDQNVLLFLLPWHAWTETLSQLLPQCYEGVSSQPGWPRCWMESLYW